MDTWQSAPIHVDGIDVRIHESADGIAFSETTDGVAFHDILFNVAQTSATIAALQEAKRRHLARIGGAQ